MGIFDSQAPKVSVPLGKEIAIVPVNEGPWQKPALERCGREKATECPPRAAGQLAQPGPIGAWPGHKHQVEMARGPTPVTIEREGSGFGGPSRTQTPSLCLEKSPI